MSNAGADNVHQLQNDTNVTQLILVQEFQEVINKYHDRITLIDLIGALEAVKFDNYLSNIFSE